MTLLTIASAVVFGQEATVVGASVAGEGGGSQSQGGGGRSCGGGDQSHGGARVGDERGLGRRWLELGGARAEEEHSRSRGFGGLRGV